MYIYIVLLEKDRCRKVENDCFLFFDHLKYLIYLIYIYIKKN